MSTKVTNTDVIKGTLAETQGVTQLLASEGLDLSSSLKEILPPVITDPFVFNQFLTKIYNKIILSRIVDGRFRNPLEPLKKGNIGGFGDTIEEIIMNPAKAFNYGNDDHNILKSAPPDAKVQYIRVNRQDAYDVSISRKQAMQAFTSEQGFSDFVTGAMNTLFNGDTIDEYRLMLKIVTDMYDSEYLLKESAATNGTDFTKQLINYAKIFQFPNTNYSQYSLKYPDESIETWVDPANIVILIRADKMTDISVDVLSAAFNLDKIQLTSNIIEVDKFGDTGIQAIICDRNYFQVYDTLYEMANFERADLLASKSYLHHWQAITCSLFAKAVCLTTDDIESGS